MNTESAPHYCSTCTISISGDLFSLRQHYSSETHIHNLRVRTRASGSAQLSLLQPSNTDVQRVSSAQYFCKLCQKTFNTALTLQDHVRSRTHRYNKLQNATRKNETLSDCKEEASLEYAESVSNSDSSITELHCLFCLRSPLFPNITTTLSHMKTVHNFEIPFENHLHDLQGLLCYLARKISAGLCITCESSERSSKEFDSLTAVQMHMRDQRHTAIPLSALSTGEYDPYYETEWLETIASDLNVDQKTRTGPFAKRGKSYCGPVKSYLDRSVGNSGPQRESGQLALQSTADGKLRQILDRGHTTGRGISGNHLTINARGQKTSLYAVNTPHSSMTSFRDRFSALRCYSGGQKLTANHAQEERARQNRMRHYQSREDRRTWDKQVLSVGVNNNRLHPKGFDGDT